ncbi:FAD-dependent monooxygenase [Nonomuraea sp. NPDC005501]|uniref:FAD-dependent monooxygenase n=1 Tax=Nonomuraea sp. NPDC005501 TaxID=3156884 RepID=UPI00339EF957
MDFDVVVAGAGPVGLMLACELRLAGVSVIVVERLTEVDTTIKAGSITLPTAEALYRRGLLPAAAETQREVFARFMRPGAGGTPGKSGPKVLGHFAGIMLHDDMLDTSDPDFAGHGPAANVSLVPQSELERLLGDRASALGVEVRRGVELTGFDQDAEGITVHTGKGPIRAAWLVGCDGGRSTVRRLAGFQFPGTDPEITGHQALVEMEGAEDLGMGWNRTDTGVYVHGPIPGRILTVQFGGPPADRDAPITTGELQAALRRVSGVDVTITAVHTATRFTDNARQATTYRMGRVLLAGDAAHVHSPFGGQGLNLGIGDAMNLGWKLAAAIRGWAPVGLLDSYTAERHPIGAWVLDWTRAQIALMRPEPHAQALRDIVTDLARTLTGTTYFAKKLSGVWQHYDLDGDHPLAGRTAPDLELTGVGKLADLLHGGQALLLDLTGGDAALGRHAEGYGDRIRVVATTCPDRPDLTGLLVRPDGIVAWASGAPDTSKTLDNALTRWFGAPSELSPA